MGEERQILAKELHKRATKFFDRRRVISNNVDEIWAIDLLDMSFYKNENEGYRYILNVIDVFSRYYFAVPLKDKTMGTTLEAFKTIITQNNRCPERLWNDEGGEFVNKQWKDYLKKHNIEMYHTHGEHKTSIAERFNKILREMMSKYFTENNTQDWVNN